MRTFLLAAAIAAASPIALLAGQAAAQTAAPASADSRLWLEEVEGAKALGWVKAHNAKAEDVLARDPRYAGLLADAVRIESAVDRIPTPSFVGQAVYNFWQDGTHVRGVWRRTTLEGFQAKDVAWETVLDLDALAKAENANWIWKGATCRKPANDRCLVALSNGGKDAVEIREFDLKTKAFVPGGFRLPEGKQTVDWLDDDTLILGRDWGPENRGAEAGAPTVTESGYAFVVKTLKRGQDLSQAKEVFRGTPKDVSASAHVLKDGQGRKVVRLERGVDFFNSEHFLLTDKGPVTLALPLKSTIHGFVDGKLIVTLEEAWTGGGAARPQGALIAATPEALIAGTGPVDTLFAPGPRQSIDAVDTTRNRVVVAAYDNVRGEVRTFAPKAGGGWTESRLPAAANSSVALVATADDDDRLFYSVEGFVTPTELTLADAASGAAKAVKALPARFDASREVVEQFEATSKDGTKIPYFVVRPKDLKFDGGAPALLYGYGGFQLSKPPVYNAELGKLWLERGGVYLQANIRGGGEFGPAWHEQVKGKNRQKAFDDFYAVAEDAIARKITSPRRLGAYGRSNGGLLMGVVFTQRPDLWNAVVIESPLLDMLRYPKLPAGASWVGEYGDPEKPDERAWIAAYSPYQNVRPGVKYPLPYISTSTKDDRVHPGHARKFAAELEDEGYPVIYYENTDGGHANSADPTAAAARWARHYTYLSRQLMD